MTWDMWHVTCDTGQVTHDMWHVTHDRWGEVNLLSKLQLLSSYGLGVKVFWRYFHKWWLTHWLTQLMSDKGVCRTTMATPGLLKTYDNTKYMYLLLKQNLCYLNPFNIKKKTLKTKLEWMRQHFRGNWQVCYFVYLFSGHKQATIIFTIVIITVFNFVITSVITNVITTVITIAINTVIITDGQTA